MKFIVNSQLLMKQLSLMSGVLPSSNVTPILTCFLFHVEDNQLSITASDEQTKIIATLPLETCSVDDVDSVAIPSRLLIDVLKTLDDVPITFLVDSSTYSIEILSGEGKYHLAGFNGDLYPKTVRIEETERTTLPASTLVNIINKTQFACSTDTARPQMTGIYMRIGQEDATIITTDGHKLVRCIRKDIKCDTTIECIMPRKPLLIVKNALSARKEDTDVTMEVNNINVAFTFDNFYIVCRLLEGHYPNIEAVIPKDNPNRLTIERNLLLRSLQRVSLFASKSTYQVRLSIEGQELNISAEDIDFSNRAQDKLRCEYEGSPIEIGFNSKFLIEMLSNIESTDIIIATSHPTRPGLIYPIYDEEEARVEDLMMLVMPVMLANG